MLLVEDFLDGEELDDSASAFVEGGAFGFGVFGVAEADEEAALAAAFAFALHDGLERVDVGSANLVDLLDLNGKPVVGEEAAFGGLGADGEDAAIDAHVAHLHLVGNADQRDDGPVLELKVRHSLTNTGAAPRLRARW
jgi:hypothetical protein